MSLLDFPVRVTGCALVLTAASLLIWRMRKREKVYVAVGTVKALLFFPIKSLKGIEVPELECTELGVKHCGVIDRSFMLVSGDSVLVSQRQEPKLTLLHVSMLGETIVITDPNGKTLKVKKEDNTNEVIKCHLHEDYVQTFDCGDTAAEFFREYLERTDVRLVCMSTENPIHTYSGKLPVYEYLKKNKPYAFQDAAPINVLSQASIDVLNTKLEREISVLNYRPNILVDGAPAFCEDNWKHLQFSSGAIVDVLLPCGRCVMTTNDPETGAKTNYESLMTLRKFRMPKDPQMSKNLGHSPMFGVNCWLQKFGKVAVGDIVSAVVEEGYVKCKG